VFGWDEEGAIACHQERFGGDYSNFFNKPYSRVSQGK